MMRILVVEDDATEAQLIERALAGRRDWTVETAADGASALEQAAQGTYGLILLDHRLPDGTGLELLPSLVAQEPQRPIVFLTGNGDPRIAREALANGAVDYLVKSVETYRTLARRLESILQVWDGVEATVSLDVSIHGRRGLHLTRGEAARLHATLSMDGLLGLLVSSHRGDVLLDALP
ncbi:MAG: response regulator, partial [Candidatus Thermoplasmatota archaeon]|nr:response regulator [Candidatus Thermoplasmatota archaeon]